MMMLQLTTMKLVIRIEPARIPIFKLLVSRWQLGLAIGHVSSSDGKSSPAILGLYVQWRDGLFSGPVVLAALCGRWRKIWAPE